MKHGFHLWMLTQKSSQSSRCTHIHKTSRKSLYKRLQQTAGNSFLEQKRSADGGMYAPRDHDNVTSVLRNNKRFCKAIDNKRFGMLTTGEMLLHDNARLNTHTAARTRVLLEHFNWELFDHPQLSSRSERPTWRDAWDHRAATMRWWKVSKHGWGHTRGRLIWHLFPDKNASVPAVTKLRSSLSMYVFLYIINFFPYCLFC
jgi:hypothetical protein